MSFFDRRKDGGGVQQPNQPPAEGEGAPSSLADERGIPPVNPRSYQSRGQLLTIVSGVVLLLALMWAVNRPTGPPKVASNDPRATRALRFDDGKATALLAPPESSPGALAPPKPPMPPSRGPVQIIPAIDGNATPPPMYDAWTSGDAVPASAGNSVGTANAGQSRALTPLEKRMRSKTVVYDARPTRGAATALEVPGLPGLRTDGSLVDAIESHRQPPDEAGGALDDNSVVRSRPATSDQEVEAAKDPHSVATLLQPARLEGASASRFPNRTLMLATGKIMDCILDTAISTTVAGMVKCALPKNVVSEDGKVVLLEKGTELTGEYRSALANGQGRLGIVWSRAKTPHGVIIKLSSPATDALGRGGIDGFVDNHFWQRYGAAILLSSLDDAFTYATARASANQVYVPTATTNTSQSAAAIALQANIQIPPTIVVNQGELVAVFVARDLDFTSVYAYRAPPVSHE